MLVRVIPLCTSVIETWQAWLDGAAGCEFTNEVMPLKLMTQRDDKVSKRLAIDTVVHSATSHHIDIIVTFRATAGQVERIRQTPCGFQMRIDKAISPLSVIILVHLLG